MRSYETQEKNIRVARGYAAYEVSHAISKSHFSDADKDTMVREALQDIIEETYYGKRRTDERRCPVCGKLYSERPALSRDGKTDICPECGMNEAIAAYVRGMMAGSKGKG